MMLLGVALVRGVLVMLRVVWGASRLGGFGGGGGLGRLGWLCGWFAWLLCRGCLSRLSRLFLDLCAEERTQGQKGPNDYDTHTRYKSTQSRANASP